MRNLFRVTLATALGFQTMVSPARASCAEIATPEEALRRSDVVFVGEVLETINRNRTAVVAVESIWKGPDILPVTRVVGGPQSPGMVTSNDRTFDEGVRYIFFPRTDSPPFEDDDCTATTELTDEIARLEPEDSRTPGSRRDNRFVIVVVVVLAAAAIYQARKAIRSPKT